jgi:hypothetical protein
MYGDDPAMSRKLLTPILLEELIICIPSSRTIRDDRRDQGRIESWHADSLVPLRIAYCFIQLWFRLTFNRRIAWNRVESMWNVVVCENTYSRIAIIVAFTHTHYAS